MNKPRHRPPPDRQEIIDLARHYSIRGIAQRLGKSRKLVTKILVEEGLLATETQPKTKLADFHQAVVERVQAGLKVPRILREIQALGYRGGRTILGELVSQLRAQQPLGPRRKIRRRFETRAGEEIQVDWSVYTVPIAHRPTRIHVLGMLLAYSRKVYYGAFPNEKQETLLEGMARGLEYFGGSALRLIFDNMATAVLGRSGPDRRPIWHPRLLEFARHYGFSPVACAVRDPDRKGKKERSFRLLEDDFIRGRAFDSWDDLQSRLRIWLDDTPDVGNRRKHGTTGLIPNEVWQAEQALLIALPETRFMVGREVIRIVDADATLSISGCRYSVPATLAHRQLPVRLYAGHFEVLNPQGTQLFSRAYIDRTSDPGNLVIDPTHYANLPRRPRDRQDGGRLDRDFLRRFPTLNPLVEGLKIRMKAIASIHLGRLIKLADTYGEAAFLQAAMKAQQHQKYDAYAVARILELEHPLPPEDLAMPLSGRGPAILGDVEEADLEDFAYLDQAIDSDQEDPDGSK